MAKPETPNPPPEGPKPFPQFLRELEDGVLVDDLGSETREILATLSEHAAQNGSAKGRLTLVLNFALGSDGVVQITADYASKLPRSSRARTMGWLTPGNNYSRTNPKQAELPLRVMPGGESARDAGAGGEAARKT
ncbi:MAG TPA: hypothetical protein PK948_06615 [Gemmatimonadales bacterium]|nr:hypothetical protein [Gemmatimonadales bacterium]